VEGCDECGDEPSSSCVTELVIYIYIYIYMLCWYHFFVQEGWKAILDPGPTISLEQLLVNFLVNYCWRDLDIKERMTEISPRVDGNWIQMA
jgi:hypothetical protein